MPDEGGFREASLPWGQKPAGLLSGVEASMRRLVYWWVNQNQTWRQEIEGGYMWSPKRNSNGAYNQTYENMHLVDIGDLVFSYFDQKIQYIGIVRRPAISWNKPSEFGLVGEYWNSEGWYVPVEWHRLPVPFRPKDILDQVRPTLPEKYSPLSQSGDGLQNVYLARVPDDMAAVLAVNIGVWIRSVEVRRSQMGDDIEIEAQLDDEVERSIEKDQSIDATEKDAVIRARRGQGRYRKNLTIIESQCRVTGVTDPRLLVASHIKPWRSCASNDERLDGHNGFLLTPHIDRLFDRGYISFDENSRVMTSKHIAPSQFYRIGIDVEKPLFVGEFSERQHQYLEYHRKVIFLPDR